MQQWRAITKDRKIQDVNSRRQHIEDLITKLQTDQFNGSITLVIGDFNEDFTDQETDGLKLLLSSCDLVNAFQVLTGTTPLSRQNHRQVFHILAHPQVLQYINKIGVLSEDTGFFSDHIPFFVNLDQSVFSLKINKVLPPAYRTLKSINSANVTKYVEYVL